MPTDHHYRRCDSQWASVAKHDQEVFTPFWRVTSDMEAHSFSLCQFWHRKAERELQSRVGTSEAGFTTKAFVVELPTMCSEHGDKLERK